MSLTFEWRDPAGTTWDLSSGGMGVKLLGGIQGLGDPPFTTYWSDRIGDGDRFRGHRHPRREMLLRVRVGTGTTGLPWRAIDSAWWRAVVPEEPGTLKCVLEDASERTIQARLGEAVNAEYQWDPAVTGYAVYAIRLVADNPFWAGPALEYTWDAPNSPSNFYGGGGGLAPPYVLSGVGTLGELSVNNPGEEPAWPLWKFTGPFTSASVTVNGGTIEVPATVTTGDVIFVQTNPPAVYDGNGVDKWSIMTGARTFTFVPAGATVPVTSLLTGSDVGAQVKLTINPQYRRAW